MTLPCMSIEIRMTTLPFKCVCFPCLLRATLPFNFNWHPYEQVVFPMYLRSFLAEGHLPFNFNSNPYYKLWFQGICFPYLLRATVPFNPPAFQFKLKISWTNIRLNVFALIACWGLLRLYIIIEILMTSSLCSRYLLSLLDEGYVAFQLNLKSSLNMLISMLLLSLLVEGYFAFQSTCLSIQIEILLGKLSFQCICFPCLLRATWPFNSNWNPHNKRLVFKVFAFLNLLRATLPFNPLAVQFYLKS